MIVYTLARFVAWLYGFSWPLPANAKSCLALMSFVSLPFEIVAVMLFIANIGVNGKKEARSDRRV